MARCKLFLIALSLFWVLPALAMQNYRATYHLSFRGVGVAEVVHEVSFTDIGYHIDTVATPSFAARILGFGEMRESCEGLLEQGRVTPQYYQRVMHGDDQYHLVYDFLARHNEIKAQIGKSVKILQHDPDLAPLDMLSMVVQSLLDIAANRPTERYTIVSEDDIDTYKIEGLPNEKWTDNKGATVPVRGYRQRHGNKQTRIYFAEHPLRLVRLEQLKKDKSRFTLELFDYQILQ